MSVKPFWNNRAYQAKEGIRKTVGWLFKQRAMIPGLGGNLFEGLRISGSGLMPGLLVGLMVMMAPMAVHAQLVTDYNPKEIYEGETLAITLALSTGAAQNWRDYPNQSFITANAGSTATHQATIGGTGDWYFASDADGTFIQVADSYGNTLANRLAGSDTSLVGSTVTFYLTANTDSDNSEGDENIVINFDDVNSNPQALTITLKNGPRPSVSTEGVTVSPTTLVLTELGGPTDATKTYTVVLGTDPGADVTITVANGDATAVAVDTDAGTSGDQSTLTFTAGGDGSGSGQGNGNWAVAQTVTVRALNDGDAVDESFNIAHSASAASGPYNNITIDPVAVTTDDAGAGVVVSESSVSVAENDETATYTLVLKSQPGGTVVISAMSGATATAEVDTDTTTGGNQSTLTFTDSTWNQPQTVTITGKGAGSTSISHAITTATAAYPVLTTITSVSVVVFAHTHVLSPLEIYEGERLTFTFQTTDTSVSNATVLVNNPNIQPLPTASYTSDYLLYGVGEENPTTTRYSNNSRAIEPISISNGSIQFDLEAVTDNSSESDETITVSISDYDDDYNFNFRHVFTVTLKDGARPASGDGVTVSPTSLALTELGADSAVEKTYTVVLDTDPTADVTVTVANGDATAVAVDTDAGTSGNQSTLTFTAGGDGSGSGQGNGNWAVAQTVTVRALNDADAAVESFNLTHTATATGSTAPYDGITIDPVAVTTVDAGHGVVVSESSVSVAENDETITYTVVLKSQPSGNVEITAASAAKTTATVSPLTLNFTASTWDEPQTVTVTGKGAGSTSISHEISSSGDTTNYPTTTTIPPVSVTVTAVGEVSLPYVTPTEFYEGETVTFKIFLSPEQATRWNDNVNDRGLGIDPFDGTAEENTDFTLSGTARDFGRQSPVQEGEYYTLSLTLQSVADNLTEGDETIIPDIGAGYVGDTTDYYQYEPVTITLKDGARPASGDGVTVSPTSLALTELGADSAVEKTYTVVLDTDPTADVTVTVANGDATAVAVDTDAGTSGDQSTLTFTAGGDGSGSGQGNGNWAVAQTVTVRALNDGDGANESFNITHTATATGSTAPYDGITIDPVAITTADAGHGVVVSESSVSVAENDETATYTLVLKSQPSGNVVISATSGATTTATVSPPTLTFTNTDWNTPQTVTVTGRDMGSTSISHAVQSSADTTNYPTSTTIPAVSVTVTADSRQVLDMSVASAAANEGSSVTVTLTATGASGSQTVAGGTSLLTFTGDGIAASDYSLTSANSFTLTGSPPTLAVALNLAADSTDEPNETLVVGWQNLPAGYRAGTTASITIVDQDPTTVTLAGSGTVVEAGSNSTDITVTLSRRLYAGEVVTVPLTLTGTGVGAGDYQIVAPSGGGLNTGVTLNTNAPHSAALPAVVLTGHDTNTVQVATLRVSAQQDRLDEGTSEVVTVGFGSGNRAVVSTLDRASGTGPAGTTTAGSATVTITDDDSAGLTLMETSGATVVSEDGNATPDTYDVVLTSEPTHDVTVTVTAGSGVQVSADGGNNYAGSRTLTFTSGNWSTAQTITVQGVGDNVDNPGGGRDVAITHTTSSTDTRYTIDPAGRVDVRVTDNDRTTVTLAGAAGDINEGQTKEITLTLGRGLVDGEVLSVPLTFGGTATRGTDYTMTGTTADGVQYNNLDSGSASVVFTGPQTGATATTATITLTATTDSSVESTAETVIIGLGTLTNTGLTNAGGARASKSLADFTIADPPSTANVTVSPTTLALTELGTSSTIAKTYTVVLDTDPGADVTVTATVPSANQSDVQIVATGGGSFGNTATLTFTSGGDGSGSGAGNGNWAVAQTVTVRALNDGDGANESFNITHAATAASGPYDGITISPVAITTADAGHGVVVSESSLSVVENDQTVTYTVVLKSQPSGSVVISATSGATANAEVDTDATMGGNQSTLTFSNTDWNTPKTVTITGKGAGSTSISHAVQSSGDTTNYPTTTTIPPVSVTVTAVGEVSLPYVTPTEFYEGERVTFTITISAEDAALWNSDPDYRNVNFRGSARIKNPSRDFEQIGQITSQMAVQSGDNFTLPITLRSLADNVTEGDETIIIQVQGGYDDDNSDYYDFGTVTITLKDGARPAAADGVTVTPTSLTLTELGSPTEVEKSYTLVLRSDPGADVTITLTNVVMSLVAVDTDAGMAGNQNTLTFTHGNSGNWNTPQTVTVRALNDGNTGNDFFRLGHSASAASGPYNNITIDPVGVTVTDAGNGVVVSESGVSVAENDATVTYTVALKSQPSGNVEITPTSGATTTATVSPQTLTFTDSTWDEPQTVTVTGKGAGSTSISHAVTTTDDATNYPTSTTIPAVSVTVTSVASQVLDLSPATGTQNEGTSVNVNITATGASGNQTVAGGTSLLTFTGGGIAASDYSLTSANSFTLTGSPPTLAVALNLAADSADEPNETLVVGWQNLPAGYRAGTTASITIVDQDPTTVTLAGGGTVMEGGSDSADITVTLSRNLVAGETVTVPLTLAGAGITASDYTLVRAPGSNLNVGVTLDTNSPHSAATPAVVFTGHETNVVQVATLRVTAVQDTSDERSSEVVTVGFGSGNRAVVSNLDRATGTGTAGTTTAGSATATITDDDPTTVTLAGAAGDINEGQTKEITLTLGRGLVNGEVLTVPLTLGGSATRNIDYTLAGTPATGVQYNNLDSGSASVVFTGPTSGTTATTATITLSASAFSFVRSGGVTVDIGLGTLVATTLAGGVTETESLAEFSILDAPGVTIAPTSLALTELGADSAVEKTYTVILDTDPTADVTITVANGDATAVAVDTDAGTTGNQNTLTFTAGGNGSGSGAGNGNWAVAQTVTVRALNDGDGANESFNLTHAATAASGPYDGITIAPVAITTADAGHGVVVSESSVSVAENDETVTYTVVLKSQPSGNVVISAASGATTTATVSPGTLTFTGSTWDEPQTVTVTGKGAGSASISHAVQSSGDATNYPTSTTINSVSVTVTEVIIPTLKVENAGGFVVAEGDAFTVTLTLSQAATRAITLTVGATVTWDCQFISCPDGATIASSNDITVATTSVNFAVGEIIKTVDIMTTEDSATEGTELFVLDVSGLTPTTEATIDDDTPADFMSFGVPHWFVRLLDDDTTPTVSIAGGAAVTEGNPASFTVSVAQEVAADLSVGLTVSDVTGSDFIAAGNEGAKSVTIAKGTKETTYEVPTVDDNTIETDGDITVAITTGSAYTTGTSPAMVTVRSDDGTGVTVSPTALALAELGADSAVAKTYTVVLGTDPGADVTITVANGDATAVAVDTNAGTSGDQSTLTFTHGNSGNWGTAQRVTVRALNDGDGANESFNLTHTATAASGPYDGITIAPVAITTTDAGHGVVVSESSLSVVENDQTVTYTVALKSQPSGNVVISATSGAIANAEVDTDANTNGPQGTLTFTGGNWNQPQTVTITGKGRGTTTITHAVSTSADTTNYPISTMIPDLSVTVDAVIPEISMVLAIGDGATRNTEGQVLVAEAEGEVGFGFSLSADEVLVQDLTVCVRVEEIGGRLANGIRTAVLTSSGNTNGAGNYQLTWINTPTDDPDSVVTVTVVAPNTAGCSATNGSYTVSTTQNADAVRIEDDEATTVTLTSTDVSMEEGNSANTANVQVELSRRLFAGEIIEVPMLALATTTGARLPGNATPDFTLSATGDGVTATNLTSATPTLTFTGHATDVVQSATLTATPANADSDTANEEITVTLPTNSQLAASTTATTVKGGVERDGTANTVAWTLLDSDRLLTGLVVIEESGTPAATTLVEGGSDTYTVKLARLPTHDVTVTATAPNGSSVTLNKAGGTPGKSQTLTFSRSGTNIWSAPQTLTVLANDNVDQPDTRSDTVTVSHTASSTDPDYTISNAGDVAVEVTGDNDPTIVNLVRVAGNTGDRVEGSLDAVEFTVTLSRALVAGEQVGVPLSLNRGTALNNDYDFRKKAGTGVTIESPNGSSPTIRFTGAGAEVATLTMTASKDTRVEGTESVVVWIKNPPTDSYTNVGGGINRSSTAYTFSFNILDPGDIVLTETGNATVVSEDGSPPTTDSYEVKLGSQPTHDVTVTVTAGSGVEVSTDGGSTYPATPTLTFTSGNWNTAQTITVKGVGDSVDNPGGGRDVTISHAATSSAVNYTFADADDDVDVRVTDNDPTTVVLAGPAGSLNEGQTKAITLTLGRGLVDGEVLTVPLTFGGTATRNTDYTLAGTAATGVQYNNLNSGSANVVFTGPTSGTTATTATITLSATADGSVESTAETVIIGMGTLTNTGLTNAGGTSETDSLADFNISDPPSTANVTVSPTTLALTELGDPSDVTKTYTLVLDTDPGADVTITVTNGDATAVAVDTDAGTSGDQNTLTFTHGGSGNWGTAQTVTVRALNDADAVGESISLTHSATAASGPYNGVTIAPVAITTTDAGHGVVVSESSLTVADNDDTATYTIVLKSQPTGNVVISATSGATTTATVAPLSVTFTNSDWNTPKTVTITGKGAGSTSITHAVQSSSDTTNYPTSTSIPAVSVTVTSTVPPGVTLTESDGSTVVSEDGTTDSYDVVLAAPPTQDVMVTVSAGSGVQVNTVGGTYGSNQTLTFTSGNWNTAQTITVRGVDDSVDNPGGGRDVAITHATSSTDSRYTIASAGDVDVRVTDDDATTVVLAGPTGNLNEGQTKTMTLTLGRGLVNGEVLTVPLTFTGTAARNTDYTLAGTVADGVQYNNLNSGNASVVFTGPQTGATATTATITLSAIADGSVESTAETVIIGLGTLTDTGLTGAGGVSETDSLGDFNISDPPSTANVTVSPTTLALTELGTSSTRQKTYTVVLDTDPGADVTITVANGDATAVAVDTDAGTNGDQSTLTFTHGGSGNWNTAQTVTVRALNDADAAGESFNLTHTATAASGPYNGVTIAPVAITTADAGHGVVVSESSVTVADNDETVTYTLVLKSQPTGNVVISATSGATATATVSPGTLTFSNTDWNTPKTVTITGKGAGSTSISHAVQSSSDTTNYPTTMTIPSVAVTVTSTATPGVTVSPTSLALTELGDPTDVTKTYTIALSTDPGADVTITVTNGDATAVAVDTDAGTNGDQSTLTFTHGGSGNWNTAQTVTVRALNDADAAGESFNITHRATAASGPYNNITIDPVAVTVTDAGHGVVVSESSRSVREDDQTATYTIVLKSQPSGNVVIAATSGATTTATIAPPSLTFTNSDWNIPQTVTITGKGVGSTSITHAVTTPTTAYPISTSIPSVSVTVTPTVPPGVTLTESGGSTEVKEDGSTTDSYDLVLATEPTDDVTLTATAGRGVEVSTDGGSSYASSQTLTFTRSGAGLWSAAQTITVRGVEDGVDHAGTVTISHATSSTDPRYNNLSVASVAVRVTDVMDKRLTTALRATAAGLIRFGRTVGQQVVDAVRDRVGADRTQGLKSRLAGEPLPLIAESSEPSESSHRQNQEYVRPHRFNYDPHQSDGFGRENDTDVIRALSDEDALRGTAFTLTTMGEEGSSFAFWGEGSISQFRGTDDGLSLEGEVRDIMLGADRSWSDHLVGALVMGSRGEITYSMGDDTGRLDTSLTSLVPYGGWHARNGLTYWGAAGIGRGTMTVTPEGEDPFEGPIDWHMVSGGVEGSLSNVSLLPEARLVWHSDVLWTRTTSEPVGDLPSLGGETTRVRLGVDATWPERSLLDGFVTPEVGMGIRYDGGDAETGFGLEVHSGLRWRDPQSHLELSLTGRTLAVHDDGAFKDWGVRFGVFWDPHPTTKEGISAAFSYDLGDGAVDDDALLGPAVFPDQRANEGRASWQSEVAYGFSRGGGMVGSPYGGIGGTSAAIDEARVGYRIEPDTPQAENMRVDVWTDLVAENEEQSVGAGLTWSW